MKGAAKFIVKGTVQGVFYRKFTEDSARGLGLRGYVRNLASGEVEVLVEGEKDDIDSLEELLWKGPQHSQIRSVTKQERKWSGDFKEFKIIRF